LEKTVIGQVKVLYRREADDWIVVNEVFNEDVYRISQIPLESTVIDLGAHIGTFALRCAKERKCTVYAYEPSFKTFQMLKRNIKLNNLEDKVKAFRQAIGGKAGIRTLYSYPKSRQSATLFRNHFGNSYYLEKENVQVITLQQVFENNKIKNCSVLKMDIEGAEKEVFTEKWAPYLQKSECILLEWHNYDGHIYANFLKRLGFSTELAGTGVPQPKYDPTFARGMLYAKKMGS